MNRKQRRAQGQTGGKDASGPPPYSPSPEIQALFQAAYGHHQQGRLPQAEQLYRQILRADPNHPDTLHLLGVMAHGAGHHDFAVDLIGRAIAVSPAYGAYHLNLGAALKALGRLAEAEKAFRVAVRLDPANANAHAHLGSALLAQERMQEAAAVFGAALRLRPDFPEACSDLGIALSNMGRLDEALAVYRDAVRLNPRDAKALSNLGICLKDLGQTQEAIAIFDRAIAEAPGMAEIHSNRGNAFNNLNQLDQAMRDFDRAIALDPNFADAQLHRAMAMLSSGDFEGGLERYEWRKKVHSILPGEGVNEPEWTGQALAGKILFVYAEQGLGDTIQFCRYASMAAGRGAQVFLAVQAALLPLLAGFDPRVSVIALGNAPSALHYQAALLSLPRAFGTALDAIPAAPAYLRADPATAAAWADRLGASTLPRVGLVWSGSRDHKNDRNRSMPLAAMAPLLDAPADWISLQKEVREADRKALRAQPKLRAFADRLTDFGQTAALIDNLDLVISVDTSVAHLAAAMGKPTFVLLPFSPDWRWMQEREDSPWYPTMRLFRQPSPGDWASVVERVRAAVEEFKPSPPSSGERAG